MDPDGVGRHFEALLARYERLIIHQIRTKITKSRDKRHTVTSKKNEVNAVVISLSNDPFTGEIARLFISCFKGGEDIYKCLTGAAELYLEEHLPRFTSQINFNRLKIPKEKGPLLDKWLSKAMLKYISFSQIQENYEQLFCLPNDLPKHLSASSLVWTNLVPTKENKNEFVQLIYSLFEAGRINNGKGEITKIVEEAALMFNVKLGEHWQSNLSASIHRAKRDYEPPIFDAIKQAYSRHTDNLIEEKRKTGAHLRKIG